MLTWTWGKPLSISYTSTFQKGFSEIQPDAGTPFRRLNFTKIYDVINCTFDLDRTKYVDFMAWYKNDLKQGAESIDFPDCILGANREGYLINDVPQYSANQNRYVLNLQFALEPLEQ